jgi:hypothetical protein
VLTGVAMLDLRGHDGPLENLPNPDATSSPTALRVRLGGVTNSQSAIPPPPSGRKASAYNLSERIAPAGHPLRVTTTIMGLPMNALVRRLDRMDDDPEPEQPGTKPAPNRVRHAATLAQSIAPPGLSCPWRQWRCW